VRWKSGADRVLGGIRVDGHAVAVQGGHQLLSGDLGLVDLSGDAVGVRVVFDSEYGRRGDALDQLVGVRHLQHGLGVHLGVRWPS